MLSCSHPLHGASTPSCGRLELGHGQVDATVSDPSMRREVPLQPGHKPSVDSLPMRSSPVHVRPQDRRHSDVEGLGDTRKLSQIPQIPSRVVDHSILVRDLRKFRRPGPNLSGEVVVMVSKASRAGWRARKGHLVFLRGRATDSGSVARSSRLGSSSVVGDLVAVLDVGTRLLLEEDEELGDCV